ncbi:MAG TPA: hypothetical protein DIV36_05290, partial [Verrucomicrobiales bacterium]|nr:hypothetical protein [Verrucomicrobiales bacterium]
HQRISFDPNIVSCLDLSFARCTGEYFFSQCHHQADMLVTKKVSFQPSFEPLLPNGFPHQARAV